MPQPCISYQEAKRLLDYDSKTGELTWAIQRGVRCPPGSKCGTFDKYGHLAVNINKRVYRGHRLIWLLMTGEWPSENIDHINRNPADNKWDNLRLANKSQNAHNTGPQKNNTSGYKGVFRSGKNRWRSQILINGNFMHLGSFETKKEAARAYNKAAKQYIGEYAKLNEIKNVV